MRTRISHRVCGIDQTQSKGIYRLAQCRSRAGNGGMALIAVIIYLLIVTALSAAFFHTIHQTMEQARKAERRNQCLYLAEAGVEKAVAELRAYPAEYRKETDTKFAQGTFSVEVTPLAEAGAFRIRSIGRLTDGGVALDERSVITEVAFADGRIVRLREAEAERW